MKTVTLFSGLAVREPIERVVLPLFRRQHGVAVDTTFEPTTVLIDLVRSGRRPDMIVAVREALLELAGEGLVAGESVQALVRSGLGVAVPPGAPVPPVNDTPELVSLLMRARSVAYSQTGASGIYLAGLLRRLGIADQVNRTATVIPKGYTGTCLLDGRADVAVQQLSELRAVPGIVLAGPFPPEVQQYTILAAADVVRPGPDHSDLRLLRGLRALLSGPEARVAYIEAGLEPVLPEG